MDGKKYCTKCGESHDEQANFCGKCGTPLNAQETKKAALPTLDPQSLDEIEPQKNESAYQPEKTYQPEQSSGIVTVLSVIGFVFGMIGMLVSFTPLVGMLAYFIGIPSLVISIIAIIVANVQRAKKTFAIVAATICGIGVVLSFYQKSKFESGVRWFEQYTKKRLGQLGTKFAPNQPAATGIVESRPNNNLNESLSNKITGNWHG